MMQPAIEVEKLGKLYRIHTTEARYKTLRESLYRAAAGIGERARRLIRQGQRVHADQDTIWALKDVSFQVKPGEVVGIIGRNGAGKSTLLKILSRITEPTQGRACIRGRVGSLLEVGTGFHPELTGRENVYLNGAILGMKRADVDKKFDEIVAFAEVEKFIDTPVKHYSSGMYLRLAFAVASHLNVDILLVDEVLAVGDAKFQQRCTGKMGSVARSGSTVLFVSHNLAAVRDLCPWSLLIDNGKLVMAGRTNDVIAAYGKLLHENQDKGQIESWLDVCGEYTPGIGPERGGGSATLEMRGRLFLQGRLAGGYLIAVVEDAFGRTVLNRRVPLKTEAPQLLEPGTYEIRICFEQFWPVPGTYTCYFKLIGWKESGVDVRKISSRAFFEVAGSSEALGKGVMAPPFQLEFRQIQQGEGYERGE
jgi:lipopolysaccharide transport system ATP-binding protein